ncbi:MAG: hypothetical protein ACHQ51_01020 [Elusimicrobiota bacterium]
MPPWNAEREATGKRREKAVIAAAVLVSAGIFGYSFLIRDGGSKRGAAPSVFDPKTAPVHANAAPAASTSLSPMPRSRPADSPRPTIQTDERPPTSAATRPISGILPSRSSSAATAGDAAARREDVVRSSKLEGEGPNSVAPSAARTARARAAAGRSSPAKASAAGAPGSSSQGLLAFGVRPRRGMSGTSKTGGYRTKADTGNRDGGGAPPEVAADGSGPAGESAGTTVSDALAARISGSQASGTAAAYGGSGGSVGASPASDAAKPPPASATGQAAGATSGGGSATLTAGTAGPDGEVPGVFGKVSAGYARLYADYLSMFGPNPVVSIPVGGSIPWARGQLTRNTDGSLTYDPGNNGQLVLMKANGTPDVLARLDENINQQWMNQYGVGLANDENQQAAFLAAMTDVMMALIEHPERFMGRANAFSMGSNGHGTVDFFVDPDTKKPMAGTPFAVMTTNDFFRSNYYYAMTGSGPPNE